MAGYSLDDYGRMLGDEGRIAAYANAIQKAVRPGSVVLELGTGTGFMAMLACQCGAARVHAVEPADVIRVAQQAARDNGFADRIVFHRALSTQLELPERCGVLISDMRGVLPCVSSHFADLMDTRERLLTGDANWICQTDTLSVAVADVPKKREQIFSRWDGSRWGLDLSSALRYATNTPVHYRNEPGDILSEPAQWATIHYPKLASPHVRGTVKLGIQRDGDAHGLALWFNAELFGGAAFSTAPGEPRHVYGNMLLPWPRVLPLRSGDRVEVKLDAVCTGSTYVWSWATIVRRDDCTEPLAEFRQSKLQGRILDPAMLARRSGDYQPRLSAERQVEQFLLDRIDGQASQNEIASALRAQFPGRYRDEASALHRVIETATRLAE